MWRWRMLGTALVLVSCGMEARVEQTDPETEPVSVIRVIDGDSLLVESRIGELEVRISGVNAPERGECHYREATERLAAMLHGAAVTMTVEGTDRYGRALARLRGDGSDIALAMIRGGHGVAGERGDSHDLAEAEEAAYREQVGMWGLRCRSSSPHSLQFDAAASALDPPGADDVRLDEEVVVLVNLGQLTVDLGDWSIRDGSSRHRFHFASGTTLAPGELLAIHSSFPDWDPGGEPVWSNHGDVALLRDRWGGLVARWRYRPPTR